MATNSRSSNPPRDGSPVLPRAGGPFTMIEKAIILVWREIDGDNLPRWEQSLLIQQMRAILAEPPSSPTNRLSAAEVIEAARSLTDE